MAAQLRAAMLAITGLPQVLGNITAAPYPRVVFQLG